MIGWFGPAGRGDGRRVAGSGRVGDRLADESTVPKEPAASLMPMVLTGRVPRRPVRSWLNSLVRFGILPESRFARISKRIEFCPAAGACDEVSLNGCLLFSENAECVVYDLDRRGAAVAVCTFVSHFVGRRRISSRPGPWTGNRLHLGPFVLAW